MMPLNIQNKVIIIIATYNGEKYIKQQLDSLFTQTYKNFEIIARDDKSSDETVEILKSYENIELINSSVNLGAKRAFATLLEYTVENSDAEYFMFCDQDDVWESDKIEKTVAKMQEMEKEFSDIPLLVHTDLEVVDEELHVITNSFMNLQKINASKNKFNNLLMQNTMTGCTLMINRQLAKQCLPIPNSAIMHDWWIGLVASKFGHIGYIDEPTIKYRQHSSNTIGAKVFSVSFIIKSIFKKVSLAGNVTQAKAFLEQFEDKLDEDTKKMLKDFSELDKKSFFQKRAILWKYKLLKQGFIRNVGLFLKI